MSKVKINIIDQDGVSHDLEKDLLWTVSVKGNASA